MFKFISISDGHDNFFTPLRILMAVLVVLGHAVVVLNGDTSTEPKLFFHYTPSYTAVNGFFIISGFLVTKSMLYREDLASFCAARILRIFPALLACVIVLTFVMGAIVTSLPLQTYLTHPETLLQPIKVLSFANTEMVLPGTFENNPEQLSGAPIWTLRYEVLAYIGTAIAFALGLLKRRWMIAMQFLGVSAAYLGAMHFGLFDSLPATVKMLLRFGIAYGLGAAIFAYGHKFKFHLSYIPIAFAAAALLAGRPEMEILYNVALAVTLFWMAYIKVPALNFLKRFDDVSYGIYIYHWAVLQVLIMVIPNFAPLPLAIVCIAISTAIAWTSWTMLEKPALKSKARFAALLSRKRPALSPAE